MSEWKEYKLGDISDDIAMGPFGSNLKTDNFISSGVPVIRGVNLNENGFTNDKFVFVSEAKAKSLKRCLAYPNELVFTHRGTIGQVAIIPERQYPYYLVSQSQMRLKVNDNFIIPKFLFYWFKSPNGQYELLKNSAQVGVPSIASPTRSLKEIDIKLPSLPTQTAIASILSSLDDKIELNNAINKNLEDLSQAIFKHWFVDFEFPDEHGRPYKSSGGEMVDSELGGIPKGWKIYSLGDVVDTVSKTYPLQEVNEVIFLNTGDILDGKFLHNNKSLSSLLPGQAKKTIQKNDILYSEIRPANKRYAFVYFSAEEYVVSTKLMVLRSKVDINPLFPYFVLTQQTTLDYLQRLAESRSGTFPQITFTELSTVKFAAKGLDFINGFTERVLLLRYELLFKTESENNSLIQLRDTLLPKLLSGELEVNEALSQIEKTI